MKFTSKYDLGSFVKLKTDVNEEKRIITSITFRGKGNEVLYGVTISDRQDTLHYDYELEKYNNKKKIAGFGNKK